MRELIIQIVYYLAAISFIVGLKKMSSPKSAVQGIKWAGLGMFAAILATLFYLGLHNWILIVVALIIGSGVAWYSGKKVLMTAMPQMIALFNGMGGGAAAAIAAVEVFKLMTQTGTLNGTTLYVLGAVGAVIGSVSFSGSLIAFSKLQGWLRKPFYFPAQQFINVAMLLGAIGLAIVFYFTHSPLIFGAFFLVSLVYGVMMTMPIGGADMPVVIALYNSLTGLAVACEGFVLNNVAMIIAGTVVGASGGLLTQLMAKAMNRPIFNILFAKFGATSCERIEGEMKSLEASDAAIMLNFVEKIIIIPGYGMAVAQAQQKVWELAQILIAQGKEVRFAIHPVAGRMPGHMNVLLAEAGVPYDYIFDLEDINNDFASTDAVVVIGANDVVNPAARTEKCSPIYGMPILNADFAKNIFVIKRGKGTGYAGIQNPLFYNDKTRLVFGDAKQVTTKMIQTLKEQA